MPLQHLEHFLSQPADPEATAIWWCYVLGLEEGPHPEFGFPVKWLYIGKKDVVHLTPGGSDVSERRKSYLGQQSTDVTGTGVVDHVAFRCTDLRYMLAHLREKKINVKHRRVDDQALYQLFLLDPNGVKVELNFDVDENIIGGLIVKVGSKMIDTSLLNKINKLKIVIKEA